MSGLNFVLIPWVPFFDPFTTQITRVDQWLRIPRLPWEFWEANYLTDLLKGIGPVVRIDQNTILRLKGKFARVCVNIDITKPLPGSVTVSRLAGCLRVPLIYEGLHEVCPLCGGESYILQSCPKLPLSQKVEVLVEKFDATGVTTAQGGSSLNPLSASNETWVTVSPKKRVKTMLPPKPKGTSNLKPPKVPIPGDSLHPSSSSFIPFHNPAPLGSDDIILANPMAFKLVNDPVDVGDPLDAHNDAMDDNDVEAFLNLHAIDDVDMSSDSSKRKRLDDGEEASSHGPN